MPKGRGLLALTVKERRAMLTALTSRSSQPFLDTPLPCSTSSPCQPVITDGLQPLQHIRFRRHDRLAPIRYVAALPSCSALSVGADGGMSSAADSAADSAGKVTGDDAPSKMRQSPRAIRIPTRRDA
jgi:hypothetical protein